MSRPHARVSSPTQCTVFTLHHMRSTHRLTTPRKGRLASRFSSGSVRTPRRTVNPSASKRALSTAVEAILAWYAAVLWTAPLYLYATQRARSRRSCWSAFAATPTVDAWPAPRGSRPRSSSSSKVHLVGNLQQGSARFASSQFAMG